MGNELSAPKEEGPHVEHQQRLFKEYQQMTQNDIEIAKKDLENWDSVKDTILDLRIENQAKYCDYVTNELCELGDEVVTSSGLSCEIQMKWLIENRQKIEVCAIANLAKTIISQNDLALKSRLLQLFGQLLDLQKELKDDLKSKLDQLDTSNPENFGEQFGKIASQLMKKVNKEFEQEESGEKIFQNLMTQLAGKEAGDHFSLKTQLIEYLREQIKAGKTLPESMNLAKEKFDVPPGTTIDVTFCINFDN